MSKTRLQLAFVSIVYILVGQAAQAAQADEIKPDCYVLSVGIDKYQQSPLQGCVNDANNIANLFQSQRGKVFGNVAGTVLLDEQATRTRIGAELKNLRTMGKAGDFVVLFISGHGGNAKPAPWFFVTYDHAGQEATKLTDKTLLNFADALSNQGKKVFLIVDACFSGQLRVSARNQLNKSYPHGGGVVLMVSSMPSQLSAAMGRFSAFAQAVFEGLSGQADYNGDGYVTLREVRTYAYHRVHDMQKKGEQDGEIDYSLSISENLKLAKASKGTAAMLMAQARAPFKNNQVTHVAQSNINLAGTQWRGRENLQGFGDLSFRFMAGGVVLMQDAQGDTPGTWTYKGNQITLSFNGGTTYAGTLQGSTLSGTARGGRGQAWSWSVAMRQ